MKWWGAALAAFFVGLGALPGKAQSADSSEATMAAERLLGSSDEQARDPALLPFTRSFGTHGVVAGTLADSVAAAGVPRALMVEALHALDDAHCTPQAGDTFYVRWEQTYVIEGQPIGVGRVLWLELATATGTVALHRYRPREGGEKFFLLSGEAATTPELALPIDDLTVSSRFGPRPDPMASRRSGIGPLPSRPGQSSIALAGFGPRLFMHEGVDFAVPQGTPIYAAADGVVAMAGPHGGYGKYVRLDHGSGVATAYAHLSRFVPGLKPGTPVVRGELLAFSGNTGRSTGPHLHFEVLADGHPVDPLTHAAVAQLGGFDLDRFAREVAARERERDSDDAAATDD
jgi:murein DD-endopeptidase MepM/ murein hydrolase activator NlpD